MIPTIGFRPSPATEAHEEREEPGAGVTLRRPVPPF